MKRSAPIAIVAGCLQLACCFVTCGSAQADYAIRFIEKGQPPGELTHHSQWNAKLANTQLIMAWSCTKFQGLDSKLPPADATMTMRVINTTKSLKAYPKSAQDHTNISRGDDQATTILNLAGSGVATVELVLALEANFPMAGEYTSEVEINITAP